MILSCTNCGARFKVDPTLLGEEGRTVRCGSCGHSWHQVPGQGEQAAASNGPDSTLDKLDEQRRRARTRRPVVTSERSAGSARALNGAAIMLVNPRDFEFVFDVSEKIIVNLWAMTDELGSVALGAGGVDNGRGVGFRVLSGRC